MTPSEFVTSISNVYIHPDYDVNTNLNDIAVAKVERSFPVNSFITKTCMPSDYSEDPHVPKADEKCFTVGWGRTNEQSVEISDTLQEVEVPIWSDCPKNDSLVVCGGFKEGEHDTCQGNSKIFVFCSTILDYNG